MDRLPRGGRRRGGGRANRHESLELGRGGGNGRGRPGGRIAAGKRPVEESTRINIKAMLEEFQASDEKEIVFPPHLDNHDRAVVHSECRKYGFTSKSYGKGESRTVTVRKVQSQQASARSSDTLALPFCPHSLSMLSRLAAEHPPSEEELARAAAGGEPEVQGMEGGEAHVSPRKRTKFPAGAEASPEELKSRAAAFTTKQGATPQSRQVAAQRAALPISGHRQQILDAVAAHQVIMVVGQTGCGKTTQVPQFLLEDSWARGARCKMVCTQPRRISAVTVSERVAWERGERIGEGSIGYQIRLESKGDASTPVMFCTNGILLRKLASRDSPEEMSQLTHIIIDEIHERDRFADFMLIVLKDILPQYPCLKLVLMSATLNEQIFARYFDGCPVITVPGFMHPVEDLYLDSILGLLGFVGEAVPMDTGDNATVPLDTPERRAVAEAVMEAFLRGGDDHFHNLLMAVSAPEDFPQAEGNSRGKLIDVQHESTGATSLMVAAGKGRSDMVNEFLARGARLGLRSRDGSTASDWARRFGHADVAATLDAALAEQSASHAATAGALALSAYQRQMNADEVDLALCVRLIEYICLDSGFPDGAVLVFLPGWDDINRLRDELEASARLSDRNKYSVLPLHSMIPAHEQKKVFQKPLPGVRKLILATNIAETSITIDDVVYVINSGRAKEKSYDPYTAVATLQAAWIPQSSEKQRRGRAGRCQPGVCFHLYSRARAASLTEFAIPELKRTPLDELCLQVKVLEETVERAGTRLPRSIAEFLAAAVEPPVPRAVENAILLLTGIGALADGERLTRLGRHLAALPLPPVAGKMLLYGIMFGVLDPVLTVACAQAYRSPFVMPMDPQGRARAEGARTRLCDARGGQSDHLALVAAYESWEAAKRAGSEHSHCTQNFLSLGTLQTIQGMRKQLANELVFRGLIQDIESASRNSNISTLVKSILAAGMYPQVGMLISALPGQQQPGKPTVAHPSGQRVRLAPGSVNSKLQPAPRKFGETYSPTMVAFSEATRGEAFLSTRESTAVTAHSLALVAGQLRVVDASESGEDEDAMEGGTQDTLPRNPMVVVDEWISFELPIEAVAPLCTLRLRLAEAFAFKVHRPGRPLPSALQAGLQTAAQVLTMEGSGDMTTAALAAQGVCPGLHPPTWMLQYQGKEGPGCRGGRGRGVLGDKGFLGKHQPRRNAEQGNNQIQVSRQGGGISTGHGRGTGRAHQTVARFLGGGRGNGLWFHSGPTGDAAQQQSRQVETFVNLHQPQVGVTEIRGMRGPGAGFGARNTGERIFIQGLQNVMVQSIEHVPYAREVNFVQGHAPSRQSYMRLQGDVMGRGLGRPGGRMGYRGSFGRRGRSRGLPQDNQRDFQGI